MLWLFGVLFVKSSVRHVCFRLSCVLASRDRFVLSLVADVNLSSHVRLRCGANMCLCSVAILCDIVSFAFGPAWRGLPHLARKQRIVHGVGKAGVARALYLFALARV